MEEQDRDQTVKMGGRETETERERGGREPETGQTHTDNYIDT